MATSSPKSGSGGRVRSLFSSLSLSLFLSLASRLKLSQQVLPSVGPLLVFFREPCRLRLKLP